MTIENRAGRRACRCTDSARRPRWVLSLTVAVGFLVAAASTARAQCTLPHTLLNGQPADSTQVMANFNALVACLANVVPGGSANSVQYHGNSGAFAGVAPMTDGQLLVGSTGSAPQAHDVVAGSGIAVTTGPGRMTIAGTSGGVGGPGLHRPIMSAPPTSIGTGLTNWLNKRDALVSDTAVGITIDAPTTGSNANINGRYMPAPAPPYTITALIGATRNAGTTNGVGIGWYDGSSKLNAISLNTAGGIPYITVSRWVSVQATTTADFTSAFNGFTQPIWFQLSDDGTNVTFAFSQDGATFLRVFSIAKSSGYLGANGYSNVIFFVDPRGSRTFGTLLSWTQT